MQLKIFHTPPEQTPVGILPLCMARKTRMVDQPGDEKSSIIHLDVSIQYRRVTDGQTDI